VTHAGGAQALEVARRDRIGAGGEGGQEPQRGVRPRVTSGAVAQCLLDGLAIARLARVLGVTGDAELARFWVETKAANSSRSAKYYTVTHWRMAWVGFGIVELVAFAATAWAFWRGRQMVIACLLVTGTPLLCRDAWFVVVLDLQAGGMWLSIALAVVIELPRALLLLYAACRLVRLSALVAVSEREQACAVGKAALKNVTASGGALPSRQSTTRKERSASLRCGSDRGTGTAPGSWAGRGGSPGHRHHQDARQGRAGAPGGRGAGGR
jgi:hypothetical protein